MPHALVSSFSVCLSPCVCVCLSVCLSLTQNSLGRYEEALAVERRIFNDEHNHDGARETVKGYIVGMGPLAAVLALPLQVRLKDCRDSADLTTGQAERCVSSSPRERTQEERMDVGVLRCLCQIQREDRKDGRERES